jgi:hypothetical protein
VRVVTLKRTNTAIEACIGDISRDFRTREDGECQIMDAKQQAMEDLQVTRAKYTAARGSSRLPIVEATRGA